MSTRINLNADMGESYGHYTIGDDENILKIVRSVNVACGMHGGDPTVMHDVALKARENGVSVGAHPGFNDLWGFGRRQIAMKPGDLEYLVAYQIGALQAMCAYAGTKVTHVKAHGALYNMAAVDKEYALAVGRAIRTVDRDLVYLVLAGSEMERAGETLNLPLAREAFVDRQYTDAGTLQSRSAPGSVIHDPSLAAKRAVRMVLDGEITAASGRKLPASFESLCVHGDEPTAIAVARAVRAGLEQAGVAVVTIPEMVHATEDSGALRKANA